jgi:hypothetical protein
MSGVDICHRFDGDNWGTLQRRSESQRGTHGILQHLLVLVPLLEAGSGPNQPSQARFWVFAFWVGNENTDHIEDADNRRRPCRGQRWWNSCGMYIGLACGRPYTLFRAGLC